MKPNFLRFLAAILCGLSLPAFGQGTAFTYQGQFNVNGAPANGDYDLTFALFTTSNAATQVGETLTNLAVGVTNGLFTTTMDFGQGIFTGPPRWMEIGVRSNGVSGAFTNLSPLQEIDAVPYAIMANSASNLLGTVPEGSLSGTYSNAVTLSSATNVLSGNGAGLLNVNAAKLGGVPPSAIWQTSGNSGTGSTTNYLGTADNNPLELHVDGARALRLEPGTSPNVIGGYGGNSVTSGATGATIGGGGVSGGVNQVTSTGGTVGGGLDNVASNLEATVSGGFDNVAVGAQSTVGGGSGNTAGENYSRIGGGAGNVILAGADHSSIAGGEGNIIQASGFAASIGGGNNNTNNSSGGAIAGGQNNLIAGGGYQPAVGGGYGNVASNWYATISGGISNTNLGNAGAIAGGQQNFAGNYYQPAVGGGVGNQANNHYATVPGGYQNIASGEFSFAAGFQAEALHEGSFVWADSQGGAFASTGSNQFLINAGGGVGINTASPLNGAALDVEGSAVGGIGSPAALVENNSTAANASPALRVVGHGNTPNGVLSVSTAGTGLLAQFGNADGFVAQLDTNGNWTANSFIGSGSNITGVSSLGGSDLIAASGTGLSLGTNIYLDNNPIYLRNDKNHGLAYCGQGVTNFPNTSVQPDGPVLWGYTGGVLGVLDASSAILSWNSNGVGVTGPFTAASFSGNGAVGWEATGGSVQAVPNTGYLLTGGSQTTVTLPTSANVSDIVRISGGGTGGWKVAQNSGQSVVGNFVAGANFRTTWTLAETASAGSYNAVACSTDGTHIVAAGYGVPIGIVTSVNSGVTWQTNSDTPDAYWTSCASSSDGTHLVVTAGGGGDEGPIYTSANSGATWTSNTAPYAFWSSCASSYDGTHLAATAANGVIYTSVNSGGTWTPSSTSGTREWNGIASSANGSNLVAVDFGYTTNGGLIYTSTNAGANWNPTIAPSQEWVRVACSANGLKIVAAVGYSSAPGYLWISDDGGVSWNIKNSSTAQAWTGVASSADGVNLLACASTVDFTGLIYYSTNSGVNWYSTGASGYWTGVATSADGTKLVAVDDAEPGHVYLSNAGAQSSTTTGTAGSLSGEQAAVTELQYIGNNQFMQISHQGTIYAQ
jgi:hypothetical protein